MIHGNHLDVHLFFEFSNTTHNFLYFILYKHSRQGHDASLAYIQHTGQLAHSSKSVTLFIKNKQTNL